MSAPKIGPALRHLRRLVAAPDAADTSDAQLLRRFVGQRDESAFELLVRRHGPMVHGLCRRVLRDGHGADDAFQATLLVLARKAGAIGKHESVEGWLYKVAYRVALRARDGAMRRARRERQVRELPAVGDPRAQADLGWAELRPVLDEELSRLPEKLRLPVVLCYLEGLTNEEAAQRLACPVGTVKTRLAQARRLLGERLTRRGLPLAAGFALAGTPPVATALSPGVVASAVRAAVPTAAGVLDACVASAPAVHLAEGVLRAMMVTKLKTAALVLAVAGFGASLGVLAGEGQAGTRDMPQAQPAEARVEQLKARIADLNRQLREAEVEAARAKAVPPRDKPIAFIFGDVPVTREELADYLLSRMKADQLDQFLNLRILEHAARERGIQVTAAEVDAQLKQEMVRAGIQETELNERVLRPQGKTLREWREEVARPQLLLKKLSRDLSVTEADLRAAYEARYGEKVECRAIVVRSAKREEAERTLGRIRSEEVTFEKEAERWLPGVGAVPVVVTRGLPKGYEHLVKVAFALKPGEVSGAVPHEGGYVILKCRQRVAPDASVSFEDAREGLKGEVAQRLSNESVKDRFEELKAKARPRVLWTPPKDVER